MLRSISQAHRDMMAGVGPWVQIRSSAPSEDEGPDLLSVGMPVMEVRPALQAGAGRAIFLLLRSHRWCSVDACLSSRQQEQSAETPSCRLRGGRLAG